MIKNPNLLILGASGGVAGAFLHHLINHRKIFNKIVLLDRNNKVLKDFFIDHKALRYSFIRKEIKLPEREAEYIKILKDNKINIVLDITDMNSLPIIEATNIAGVSYLNTAMNDEKKTVADLLFDIYPRKKKINKAVHILCAGMNPGNVNMWVRYGIERFGLPREITHFEYDTSMFVKKWRPMMTWSIHEFLVEMVRDPSGIALSHGKVKKLLPNALQNNTNLKKILEPIMKLDNYPQGLTVLHEENLSVSFKYGIPSKFFYAFNQKTMVALIKIYEKKGNVEKGDLKLGDNTTDMLDGSDNIGVMLDYKDKIIYYFNTVSNLAVIGTNATYSQIIVGVFSALFTLIFDDLKPAVYFVEDLYDTHYRYFMFDNMRVEEFVFKKTPHKLKLANYNPMIKVKGKDKFKHLYIS